ncbi:MAG: hypothetical protein MIO93_04870 [ANME-2 cluster archaeon]|jgi:DNA repair exonuclease SbcCD ATPase subunit|nr:hypothetical protein [ANME-2 cluster archaeon]
MTLFKKTKTDSKKDENKDIDFLKQNITSDLDEKTSDKSETVPKLSDILGNKPDVKSKLSEINFEAKTIEERNRGNVPDENKSEPSIKKPGIGDVREALASAIKEQSAAAAITATKSEAQATMVKSPATEATTASKPEAQATTVKSSAAEATTASKPEAQATTVKSPAAEATTAVKPETQTTSGMTQDSLKEVQAQLDDQKKLIDEQNKTIKNLESTINKMESGDVNQLVKQNQDLLTQLSQRIDAVEKGNLTEGEEAISDEEQALVKAGKYLENHMKKVNDVYDKLDNKITDMRAFMAEVNEKEREFMETEDKLNKIQRKAESIIESELLSKSNEAIQNLEDSKTKIVEESGQLLEEVEKKLENFKYEIESFKENSKKSINETSEMLKVTEYEVKKAIDEKIEYDQENMKRVNEVISIMNETVQKILGKEENNA